MLMHTHVIKIRSTLMQLVPHSSHAASASLITHASIITHASLITHSSLITHAASASLITHASIITHHSSLMQLVHHSSLITHAASASLITHAASASLITCRGSSRYLHTRKERTLSCTLMTSGLLNAALLLRIQIKAHCKPDSRNCLASSMGLW